ncbi:hypothetical protein SS50377_20219 [Spironucleus salmonicida]|uniref:Uncharacterized protein n=1 Tax=Spironucleus salmonicida TaxID=348837 RepID=V6LKW7_9EUKA|nr:hypothetical protein SS50377_20219 [Spironucleus salmonicida]|eukprot:EST45275.1 Hypothetical protein SS50377_14851 [Spironucleus salmonicida]
MQPRILMNCEPYKLNRLLLMHCRVQFIWKSLRNLLRQAPEPRWRQSNLLSLQGQLLQLAQQLLGLDYEHGIQSSVQHGHRTNYLVCNLRIHAPITMQPVRRVGLASIPAAPALKLQSKLRLQRKLNPLHHLQGLHLQLRQLIWTPKHPLAYLPGNLLQVTSYTACYNA